MIIEGYPSDGRKSKTFQVLMGDGHMKASGTQSHDYRVLGLLGLVQQQCA